MADLRKTSRKQILKAIRYSVSNAKNFHIEASHLLSKAYYTRACALNIMAIEEAGRAVAYSMLLHRDRHSMSTKATKTWGRILHRFHDTKISLVYGAQKWKGLIASRIMSRRNNENVEGKYTDSRSKLFRLAEAYLIIDQLLKKLRLGDLQDLKKRCLYVDFNTRKPTRPLIMTKKISEALSIITNSEVGSVMALNEEIKRSKNYHLIEDLIDTITGYWEIGEVYRRIQDLEKKKRAHSDGQLAS